MSICKNCRNVTAADFRNVEFCQRTCLSASANHRMKRKILTRFCKFQSGWDFVQLYFMQQVQFRFKDIQTRKHITQAFKFFLNLWVKFIKVSRFFHNKKDRHIISQQFLIWRLSNNIFQTILDTIYSSKVTLNRRTSRQSLGNFQQK